ncbi:MAG: 4-alpha-glucanotransferase [Candidatus Eisenbacteria bacterium]|uniref:4-alpha-glucanotransferase n=1 Tax=Eiseniibacteriota bacterium TaxID=2212470 RepID=A0A849SNE7_UNCEI|nr:4-alpha-glucanotransferase [Candidatus Eisenbacteria bacterium]
MNPLRRGGLLLHPTSLPGRFGIGDLGPEASRWVQAVAESGLSLWQVLPLGPTGFGDSPYQCFSAFGGNPLLVSPERLREDGLLTAADLDSTPAFPLSHVDFGPVIAFKSALLDRAFERFESSPPAALRGAFEAFGEAQDHWLDDYALFAALKREYGGYAWTRWAPELARREPAALAVARARLARELRSERFRQFAFFRQWSRLREEARAAGVAIVGDVPIFVAHDSADVWAHPELFHLDAQLQPSIVAGVPPDYFSATGQRWGNPLYRWDVLEARGYDWWVERLRAVLELVDLVRLDHFRGFDTYWEVPADSATAEHGRWVAGPGDDFFRAMRDALGGLPLIAEDLGDVRPEVLELRDRWGLPGMTVLQFGFEADDHEFAPHRHVPQRVVYTGTHDNDTTRGWFAAAEESTRDRLRRYLATDAHDVAWDLIREAFRSVATTAIVPLQDVLDLGAEARMNLPGRPAGNWTWRFTADRFGAAPRERLRELASLYGRRAVDAGASSDLSSRRAG